MNRDQVERTQRPINLMTRATEIRLRSDLSNARELTQKYREEIGETAGDSRDWHDNFGFEQATREANLHAGRVHNLQSALENVHIIEPRHETDSVGIGNTVRVHFAGEDLEEELTILGPHDSATNPDWISYESPLGSSMLGKKVEEMVDYQIDKRKLRVRVVGIEPGKFDNNIAEAKTAAEPGDQSNIVDADFPQQRTITFTEKSSKESPVVESLKRPRVVSAPPKSEPLRISGQGEAKKDAAKPDPGLIFKSLTSSLRERSDPYSSNTTRRDLGNGLARVEQTLEFTDRGQKVRVTLVTMPKVIAKKPQPGGGIANEYSKTEITRELIHEKFIDGRWVKIPMK
ncbi:GreA/GreB family elongation factor [Candidatus Daviesbacteria bacterium]|nr:GreA/GreB family elongation factor [Candidatus Daviesbacteria bacterium]